MINFHLDKYRNILSNYNKGISIESRLESGIEVNINQLKGNGRQENSKQVFCHYYSGWYLGSMGGGQYYSASIVNEKKSLEQYKERLLNFDKGLYSCKFQNNSSFHRDKRIKEDDLLEKSGEIINEINRELDQLIKEDKKSNLWINLFSRRIRKYYFNNIGCYIDLGNEDLIYIELAIKGGRHNINDTILLIPNQEKSIKDDIKEWLKNILKIYDSKVIQLGKGKYPILLSSTATGMITHEVFGHNYETDWGTGVSLNNDMNKLEWLTVIDDPSMREYLRYYYDDCGVQSSPTIIIQNGKEKSYLNTIRSKGYITSNNRAQDYRHPPITRMSNTYIRAGNHKDYDLEKSLDNGIIIDKLYNNIKLYNNTLFLPIRLGRAVKENKEVGYIKDKMVKVTGKSLAMAKVGDKVNLNLLWCNKNGQEIVVGAGGPRIYLNCGVLS